MALALASAQTANSPFIVAITAESPAVRVGPDSYKVKAGDDVFINVRVTNTSKQALSLCVDADSRTGVNPYHRYEVRDKSGNSLKKRTINHPEIGSSFHGWPGRPLEPAASTDLSGDRISALYDLTQPGKYTVRMARASEENPKRGEVISNIITLTVVE